MTAFNPIPASDILKEIEPDAAGIDVRSIIADLAEAGLIKSYARLISKDGSPHVDEVRDARLGRDTWQRINRQGLAEDIWKTGSVRLASGDGKPEMSVIGVRFEKQAVFSALAKHGVALGKSDVEAKQPSQSAGRPRRNEESVSSHSVETPQSSAQPVKEPKAARAVPALDEVETLTIDETTCHLRVGRTTIYELVRKGELDAKKIGSRTVITTASIRRYLGRG